LGEKNSPGNAQGREVFAKELSHFLSFSFASNFPMAAQVHRRYVRTERERHSFVDKRLRVGWKTRWANECRPRGSDGLFINAASVARDFDYVRVEERDKDKVTKLVALYWKKKVMEPTFHPGQHGGFRYCKLQNLPGARLFVCASLFQQITDVPESNINTLVSVANRAAAEVAAFHNQPVVELSEKYVRRIFQSWGWSWKVPTVVQLHKFTPDNMARYLDYVIFMRSIPLHRIVFTDESHFCSRGAISSALTLHYSLFSLMKLFISL
jgi:hypothetical protein